MADATMTFPVSTAAKRIRSLRCMLTNYIGGLGELLELAVEHGADGAYEVEAALEVVFEGVFVDVVEVATGRDVLERTVDVDLDEFEVAGQLVADTQHKQFLAGLYLTELREQQGDEGIVIAGVHHIQVLHLITEHDVSVIIDLGMVAHLFEDADYQFLLGHRN